MKAAALNSPLWGEKEKGVIPMEIVQKLKKKAEVFSNTEDYLWPDILQ